MGDFGLRKVIEIILKATNQIGPPAKQAAADLKNVEKSTDSLSKSLKGTFVAGAVVAAVRGLEALQQQARSTAVSIRQMERDFEAGAATISKANETLRAQRDFLGRDYVAALAEASDGSDALRMAHEKLMLKMTGTKSVGDGLIMMWAALTGQIGEYRQQQEEATKAMERARSVTKGHEEFVKKFTATQKADTKAFNDRIAAMRQQQAIERAVAEGTAEHVKRIEEERMALLRITLQTEAFDRAAKNFSPDKIEGTSGIGVNAPPVTEPAVFTQVQERITEMQIAVATFVNSADNAFTGIGIKAAMAADQFLTSWSHSFARAAIIEKNFADFSKRVFKEWAAFLLGELTKIILKLIIAAAIRAFLGGANPGSLLATIGQASSLVGMVGGPTGPIPPARGIAFRMPIRGQTVVNANIQAGFGGRSEAIQIAETIASLVGQRRAFSGA